MIEIGKYNDLRILRHTSVGLYLGDESGEDVLLPNKYCPEEYELEDIIRVFVYLDYDERKIATNIIPKIHLDEFAFLKVSSVESVGAFMDWGLEKELMVPFSEQRLKMEEGRWYIVYLDIDIETDRLFASNRLDNYLQNVALTVTEGEEVDLMVMQKTDLGFSVIVNNKHKGLIFQNEIFRELNIGDKLKGYVKKIREDNKIDISLQAIGFEKSIDINTDLILDSLKNNNGFLQLTDKSSPEEISSYFGMSKKAFKKSIGNLYKQKKIIIEAEGIRLIQEGKS
ncbi:MAG: GntR family transcriptional regulator [Bacteroidales bacterium]|nr:GntR family transcriptional regulator [Bacteroidales bacterium]